MFSLSLVCRGGSSECAVSVSATEVGRGDCPPGRLSHVYDGLRCEDAEEEGWYSSIAHTHTRARAHTHTHMHTHTCTRARTEHRYKRKANTTVLNHVLAFCGTYSKGNESARPGAAVLDAGEPTSVTQEARDYTLTDPHFLFSSPLFSSLLFSSLLFSSLLFSSNVRTRPHANTHCRALTLLEHRSLAVQCFCCRHSFCSTVLQTFASATQVSSTNFYMHSLTPLTHTTCTHVCEADVLRSSPGTFTARKWTRYAAWYFRCDNELDHYCKRRCCRC